MPAKKRTSQTPTKENPVPEGTGSAEAAPDVSGTAVVAVEKDGLSPVSTTASFVCPLCLRPEVVDPIVLPPHAAPATVPESLGNVCVVCRSCAQDWLLAVSKKTSEASTGGSTRAQLLDRCPQCRGEFAAGVLDDALEDASSMLTLAEAEDALIRQNSAKIGKKGGTASAAIVPRNMQSSVEQQNNEKMLCGICEAAAGVVECAQCRFYICAECQVSVHSKGQFRRHEVSQVGPLASGEQQQQSRKQPNKACPQHSSNSLDLYCHTCSSCICVVCCFSGPHREHKVEPLGEVANALESSMKEQRVSVQRCAALAGSVALQLSEASPVLRQRTSSVEKAIKDTFTKLREAVDSRERHLLQELDTFVNRKVAAMVSYSDSFRLVERQAQRLLAGTELLSTALHAADLVKVQRLVAARFEEINKSLHAITPAGVGSRNGNSRAGEGEQDAAEIRERFTSRLVPTLQDVVFVSIDSNVDKAVALFTTELDRYGKLKLPAEVPLSSMTAIADNVALAAAAASIDRKSVGRQSLGAVGQAALAPPPSLGNAKQGATSPGRVGGPVDHLADVGGPMIGSVSKRRQFLSLVEEQVAGEPVRKTNEVRATMPSLANMFTSLPKRTAGGAAPPAPKQGNSTGGADASTIRTAELGNLQLRV